MQLCRLNGLEPEAVRAVAVASVVPALDAVVERMCRTYFQREPLFVNASNQKILRVEYRPPADAGVDRIVNAAGAYRKHGGPLVILDFGTATTLDAVSRDGVYPGRGHRPGHPPRRGGAGVAHRPAAPGGRRHAPSAHRPLDAGEHPVGLVLRPPLPGGGAGGAVPGKPGPGNPGDRHGGLADAFGGDLPWVDAREPDLTLEGLYYIYRSITDG